MLSLSCRRSPHHLCRHFVIDALSLSSLSPLPCQCRRRCGARCHVASMCEHMGGSRDGDDCEGRGLEHEGELYSPSSASSRHCVVDGTSWHAVAPVVALRWCRSLPCCYGVVARIVVMSTCGWLYEGGVKTRCGPVPHRVTMLRRGRRVRVSPCGRPCLKFNHGVAVHRSRSRRKEGA